VAQKLYHTAFPIVHGGIGNSTLGNGTLVI
jgi:hypothetical protein